MSPARRSLAARRAERALERDYEQLKTTTLRSVQRKLQSRRMHYDEADLEGFYNQAWHALYAKLSRDEEVENPGGFLAQAAFFRAVDDYRRLHPDQRAEHGDPAEVAASDNVEEHLDDVRKLREFIEAMSDRLSDRERRAAALCYLHGYTRPEAAQALGLSDSRMQKLMDVVSKKVGVFVGEIQSGGWCESRSSLMAAYALGVLDPEGERHRLAVAHLKTCSGCRAYVLRTRGIAAVVPPILLPWAVIKLPIAGLLAGANGAHASAAGGSGAASGGGGGGASSSSSSGGGGVGAAAVAAMAVVAAGAVAAGLVATGTIDVGGDDPKPPSVSARPATPAKPAAAAPAPAKAKPSAAAPAAKPKSKPKPKPKPKPKKRQAPATHPVVAPTPVAPAPSPAPIPAQTTTESAPLHDAAQEFSVEEG